MLKKCKKVYTLINVVILNYRYYLEGTLGPAKIDDIILLNVFDIALTQDIILDFYNNNYVDYDNLIFDISRDYATNYHCRTLKDLLNSILSISSIDTLLNFNY